MEIELFKGELQGKSISFGALLKKRVLAFEKDGKYLFPRDKQKQLLELPSDVDIKKIKKNSPETVKAIQFYLDKQELQGTGFHSYLIQYYLTFEIQPDVFFQELDEEGKIFFEPLLKIFLRPRFVRNGTCVTDYWKESKVMSRYSIMDLELIFSTILRDIEQILFKEKKPVSIFPLRYSARYITNETIEKMNEIFSNKISQWLDWRAILIKDKYLYNYLIHWIFIILEHVYPEDEELVKELSQLAERAEVVKNEGLIEALRNSEDYKAESIGSISLNKHLLYYFSIQFLYGGLELSFKKPKKMLSFGYQDVLLSLANSYSTIPLFTAINPPFSLVSHALMDWVDLDFSPQALKGNSKLDPYRIVSNALNFFIAVISSKTKNKKERNYLVAKTIQRLLTGSNLMDSIKALKQHNSSMKGETIPPEKIDVSDKEIEEKQNEINEKISKYIKELKYKADKQNKLDVIIDGFNFIGKSYDDIKESKDDHLKISKDILKEINEFQKDFFLAIQLVENDVEALNTLGQLTVFLNNYLKFGSPSDLHGFVLNIWLASMEGNWKWIKTNDTSMTSQEEGKMLVKICTIYNTSLQGYLLQQRPFIETTAPTIIFQATQNLKELLVAKDQSGEKSFPIYTSLLKSLKKLYLS